VFSEHGHCMHNYGLADLLLNCSGADFCSLFFNGVVTLVFVEECEFPRLDARAR